MPTLLLDAILTIKLNPHFKSGEIVFVTINLSFCQEKEEWELTEIYSKVDAEEII